FAGLTLDKEEEAILRVQVDSDLVREEEALSLVGCFLIASHSDSFCEVKMKAGVEITEIGWDLSLHVQSKRAQAMSSVWLMEEGGIVGRNSRSDDSRGNNGWGGVKRFECDKDIYPVLGFNLEGKRDPLRLEKDKILLDQIQTTMDHDLENEVVIGEERKKKARGDIEESSNIGGRNRRMSEVTHLLSVAAKRQANRSQ
ncbi:hypothetical protein Goshw_029176, partial [Gossypium schwendimanii]|nr:hypothetical protein [Gossypium schwendimanii]